VRTIFASKNSPGGPAIFIDRDGVINRRRAGGYVLDWSEFVFMPGIREALRRLALLRLPIIVISNQSAVGRGLLKPSVLENITSRMQQTLLADGTSLSAVYYCTHKPDDGCICRKPRPELLFRAAVDFSVDLPRSVFIGDSDADARAAQLAGCQPLLFGPGLTACSDSPDWMTGLPVARTSEEIFQVVADSLQAVEQVASTPFPGQV
jgi:D-glycero-D-manno-heptose 1,7-bisphosphate phosphatase